MAPQQPFRMGKRRGKRTDGFVDLGQAIQPGLFASGSGNSDPAIVNHGKF
jgi:hypothetical protein